VLCKAGGTPLLMLVKNGGFSCLYQAAAKAHGDVVEVGAGWGWTVRVRRACVGSDGTWHVVQEL